MRASLRSIARVIALLPPLTAGACQCGAGPSTSTDEAPADAALAATSESAAPPEPVPSIGPSDSAAPEPPPRVVGASQILIAYKGAELAGPGVARSKQAAKQEAEDVLARLSEGKATFEELAARHSDDPTRAVGGAMGNFERDAVPPALGDAAFALKIGQTSGVVETARGFHIVRRTR